ncbi:flagellar transcriptional regulator FlhD [Pseudorhodoferax sp.]|uniref:flagellar transcriptional regulator FlhD n=1 Tax=Pseudorhodoferax sp. TaxID=1993553 RepID=UPI0039E28BD1
MDTEQIAAEIREANLTYLMLAQSLIRQDKAEALFRLGLSERAADLLGALSATQLLRLASSSLLLCRFRVEDDRVWQLLAHRDAEHKAGSAAAGRLHAGILMAGRVAEVV